MEQTQVVSSVAVPMKPKKPLIAHDWLAQLASSTGVMWDAVPDEVKKQTKDMQDKGLINQAFFAWFNNKPAVEVEFDEESKKLFTELAAISNTREFRTHEDRIKSAVSQAMSYHREMQSYLTQAMEAREKLDVLTRSQGKDITPEILEICKDGFFKYNPERTKAYNTMNRDKAVCFVTPRVYMRFFKPAAGIDMNVDMGSFEVQYVPSQAVIKVMKHEDNLVHGSTYHSHVNSNGTVCWGNAADTYQKSMLERTPSKVFPALRTILQNYNETSPYVTIDNYDRYRKAKMPIKTTDESGRMFRVFGEEGWIHENDMPSYCDYTDHHIDTRSSDDRGGDEYKFKVYIEVNALKERIDHDNYYLARSANRGGGYVAVPEETIIEWE